ETRTAAAWSRRTGSCANESSDWSASSASARPRVRMHRDRAADELSRWAGRQVPELLARAEAEAVAVLRDALVEAALRERQAAAATERRAGPPVASPASTVPRAPSPSGGAGELLWIYCVLGAGAPLPPNLHGID